MGRLKITQEDDSIRTVAYLDEVQDLANDVDANINKIENLTEDFDEHKEDYMMHLETDMPHIFKNLKTGKTYRYGERVSAVGIPQIIYEEVI